MPLNRWHLDCSSPPQEANMDERDVERRDDDDRFEESAKAPTPAAPEVPLITPGDRSKTRHSAPTATHTIRDGEIQGHPREMPSDRE
jgi:hypothetical protein